MEAGDFSSQRRTSAAFARGISASEHEHGISLKQQRKAAVPALKRRADLFDAAVPALYMRPFTVDERRIEQTVSMPPDMLMHFIFIAYSLSAAVRAGEHRLLPDSDTDMKLSII